MRIGLARHPWIHWVLVTALASVVAIGVHDAMTDLRRERDAWGERRTVYVATSEIAPGEDIAGAVAARDVPLMVVPDGALRAVEAGDTARQRIGTGEIVVDVDIGSVPGPLAVLPDDWLAVTVDGAVDGSFAPGTAAVVLAAGDVVAPDAVIVEVLDDGLVIGVPVEVAADVANMVGQRLAVVALAG